MFSTTTARRALFSGPSPKAQRLNYEGDVKMTQNPVLGYNISFDPKTGMPIGVTTPQTKKAFCKVCHDAGKPESIYTSHFVRAAPSPDAPVVCPTLLAQPCRYCGVAGHTVKYCPGLQTAKAQSLLQQVPALPNQQEFQADFVKQAKKVNLRIAKDEMDRCVNAYAALAITSSDDDEDESQSGRNSPDYSPPKENIDEDENDELLNLYGDMNVLSKHSLVSILEVLKPFKQTSNYHVVQLCFCLEAALDKKEKKNPTKRPPFCSPLPTKPTATAVSDKRDWADSDDEEMDFNTTLSLPNFPPLPAPALKRTYAEMAKQ